ncbi:unnamed protein product [Bursaphelenchus xylophilus]|uniref:Raf homolog serine/threonine-protein kinase n=1 Tax=Bursaphelenchus xylophilus TaxID=6326 RepID=A0A1I7RSM0_BURXY|nr:unnamed protein product [Bursaphelenchus xylophilus]CAG9122873.1 unnamed protein product [Bursaphelenchus xylophilus]
MSKDLILVHLPFGQHSKLNVRRGETLRDAIANILTKRRIKPELCTVCVSADPDSYQVDLKQSLSHCAHKYKELWVHSDCLELFKTVHHEFVPKNFLAMTLCGVCNKMILFHGYRCNRCKFNFHTKCWGRVPALCESDQLSYDATRAESIRNICARYGPHARMATTVFEALLPAGSRSLASSTPTLDFDRSASTPNIADKDELNDSSDVLSCSIQSNDINESSTPRSAPPKESGNFFHEKHRKHQKKISESSDWLSSSNNNHRRKTDTWEINYKKVTFQGKIGQGSYGTVYKAYYFGPVAVKMLNIQHPNISQLTSFENEITLLKKARHGNILNFVGVILEPTLSIVTQWCRGSSLFRHLHILEDSRFEITDTLDIAKQTALGMDYLHSKTVLHRDLKSSNIFLTEGMRVKIGDFGLATVQNISEMSSDNALTLTGSILWMAPEVIRMKEPNPYSTKSDIYSYGVVLYELLSGKLPYEHIENRDQILFCVGSGILRPNAEDIQHYAPTLLKNLFESCVSFKPERRPEFREVLKLLDNVHLGRLIKSATESNLSKSFNDLP